MKTTTVPASRFGWEGQTLTYTVKAEGATEVRAPQDAKKGLTFRITEQRQTADGVEAEVAVDVASPEFY